MSHVINSNSRAPAASKRDDSIQADRTVVRNEFITSYFSRGRPSGRPTRDALKRVPTHHAFQCVMP